MLPAENSTQPAAGVLPLAVQGAECPLNHGLVVLDLLLSEIIRDDDWSSTDAALELRLLLASAAPAGEAVIEGLYRLRESLDERHYLAFYRLRRWLSGRLTARISADRGNRHVTVPVRLDAPDLGQLKAACAELAGIVTPWLRVRFDYRPDAVFAESSALSV